MASGTTLRVLRSISSNHLECSVCMERYSHPKILDCQHSFCTRCLEEYWDFSGQGTGIICPACPRETPLPEAGISALQTNLGLVSLLEEIEFHERGAGTESTAVPCETGDSTASGPPCPHCRRGMNLNCCGDQKCSHCIAASGCDRQEQEPVQESATESECLKHGEVDQLYCTECRQAICKVCASLEHSGPGHQCKGREEAARNLRQSMEARLRHLSKDVDALQESLWNITEARRMLSESLTRTRKEVQDRASDVTAVVRAEEERVLSQIRVFEQDFPSLEQHEEEVSALLRRKRQSLERAKVITNNASDADFISHFKEMDDDLKLLSSQHPAEISRRPGYARFMEARPIYEVELGEVVREDAWRLGSEFGTRGTGEGKFQLARGITAATDGGDIAVTDWTNGRVVICDHQGKTKRILPARANDVVALPDRWVLVNTGTVQVYSEDDGTLSSEFGTVPESEESDKTGTFPWLVSVAVKANGHIVAGDSKRMVLTEHDASDGGRLVRTYPVKTKPDFLAALGNGSRLVVSSWEPARMEVIKSADGTTACIIRPFIDGRRAGHCGGVCSDATSGIYAVVNAGFTNGGHVHHYDKEGQFISCVARDFFDPCGIALTREGQLAVADWYSVKLYHKL